MFAVLAFSLLVAFSISPGPAGAAQVDGDAAAQRTLVLDGSAVHDVGAVHLNITNWGLIGSRPGTGAPYSDAPSLEYLGVDHLWAAGLWVGGIVDGEARVSTGQFTPELLPDPDDPSDIIYESVEKAKGQRRYPTGHADDDNDRLEDEDPLDGRDNDGDGRIDEDGAAIGDQYLRAVMRDDTPLAQELFADHVPLGIELIQESAQWEADHLDDFVGMRYTIINRSDAIIEAPYVGMFADFDIGSAADDWARFHDGPVVAYDGSTVDVQLARVVSDGAREGAHAGIVLANRNHAASSFQVYTGNQPFDRGGDPTNDAERYQSLSSGEFDAGNDRANDVRVLLAVGPFEDLAPGESCTIDLAFVVGETRDDLIQNAANAVRLGQGRLYDRDHDRTTGVDGKEFHVAWHAGKGKKKGHAKNGLQLKAVRSPSNPRIELQYELPAHAATRMDIFDARGRRVTTLLDKVMDAGTGQIVWDGSDFQHRSVSSGVYYVRLQQGQLIATTHAVIVR